jgi:hypothetical protein
MNNSTDYISNIFLDFLNHESREIFDIFRILSKEKHIDFLAKTINIAVFLCRDYCIATPGSILESNLVKTAINRRSDFLANRIIRLPLREDSIGELLEKKESEYRLFKNQYTSLYSKNNHNILELYSSANIHRSSNVGKEIIRGWQSGPDTKNIWKEMSDLIPSSRLKGILEIPKQLREEGLAIKGPTILSRIGKNLGTNPKQFRHILQHHYLEPYLNEFSLELIYDIPYFITRFGYKENNLYYNYNAIKAALTPASLWESICNMSAASLSILKTRAGYHTFQNVFFNIAKECKNINEVSRIYSFARQRIKQAMIETKTINLYEDGTVVPVNGFEFDSAELDAIEYRMLKIAEESNNVKRDVFIENLAERPPVLSHVRSQTMVKTILVLSANPKNTEQLRLDQEMREITNGLERAQNRDEFILKQTWAARPVDARRAMLDYNPNIVHFCGHGAGEEGIALEDDYGQVKLVSSDALAGFFELFADKVECVVLNACYSEAQAEAIAKHIPYVIGMKNAIEDKAAIEFAVAFYDAIGAGRPIEFAYKLACSAIQMEGIPEHLTPVLKLKDQAPHK